MPKRHSVKTVITPYELQGSDDDKAWIKFKPPTMQEAQNLRLIKQGIDKQTEKALNDYALELNKPVSELTDDDKELAYNNAGLTEDVMNKANEMLAGFILEWNWVDDNDEPLPQPKDDFTVFGKLYPQEYSHVMSLFSTDSNTEKN